MHIIKSDTEQVTNDTNSFYHKTWLQRFCTVLAGPLMNYWLAIVIFTGFYAYYGKVTIPTVIGTVIPCSPAEKAGLQADDHIIGINGEYVTDFSQLQHIILINNEKPLTLTVQRKEKIFAVRITPTSAPISLQTQKGAQIGIVTKYKPVHNTNISILACAIAAVKDIVDISLSTLKAINQMFSGVDNLRDLRGPLTIAKVSGNALEQGQSAYLIFLAMLSINVGLVHLLPIPMLDGEHLIFMIYEAITGSALNTRVQRILLAFGIWVIMLLTTTAILNDIRNSCIDLVRE